MEEKRALEKWFVQRRPALHAAARECINQTTNTVRAAQRAAPSTSAANCLYHIERALARSDLQPSALLLRCLELSLFERYSLSGRAVNATRTPSLELVNDEVVNETIELSRVASRIRSEVEWELQAASRILADRTGQPQESTASLDPAAFVRALWQFTDALGLNAPERVACIRAATDAIKVLVLKALSLINEHFGHTDVSKGLTIVRLSAVRRNDELPVDILPVSTSRASTSLTVTRKACPHTEPVRPDPLELRDIVFKRITSDVEQILLDLRFSHETRRVQSGIQLIILRFAFASPQMFTDTQNRAWLISRKLHAYVVAHCLHDRVAHDDLVLFADHIIQTLVAIDISDQNAFESKLISLDAYLDNRPLQLAADERHEVERFAQTEAKRDARLKAALSKQRGKLAALVVQEQLPYRLRQFFLADWAEVLAQTELAEGQDSQRYHQHWRTAENLILQISGVQAAFMSSDRIRNAIDQLEQGMTVVAVPSVEKYELVNALLQASGNVLGPKSVGLASDYTRESRYWGVHNKAMTFGAAEGCTGGLTTAIPAADAEQLVATLRSGTLVELFLMGGWFEAKITSINEAENIFVFEDEQSDATHRLTRRALVRLVREGLVIML